MTTITREEIERYLSAAEMTQICDFDKGKLIAVTPEHMVDLARIALASLEAEPVAYIIQDADARSRGEKGILRYFANISDEDINEYEITVTPLYTAPPAPVDNDDLREAVGDLLAVLDEYPEQLVPINRKSFLVRTIRAAMLNGGKS